MNTPDENYETLSQAMAGLRNQGYTVDFNLTGNCIICSRDGFSLSPADFQVDKTYRFEGMSDPDDNVILYAISADGLGVKGQLVNAYGVYADDISQEMVDRLAITR